MKKPNISISFFMPAFNEAENIEYAINSAIKILKQITNRYEIIIIDDGSTDQTVKIIKRLKQKLKNLILIQNGRNYGYGYAIRTGVNHARHELIFYTDADNQFGLGSLKKSVELIGSYDMVIGFRKNRKDSFQRLVISSIYNKLIRLLFGIEMKDINCSFKLFRLEIFRRNRLSSNTVFIDAEMVIQASKSGYKIKEIPIDHFKRKKGVSKFEIGKKGVFMFIHPGKISQIVEEIIRLYPKLSHFPTYSHKRESKRKV